MKRRLPAPTTLCRPRGTTLRSDDGVIEFTLSPTSHGVFVERVQLRPGTARTVHSTLFYDERSFERWCDADAVRFEYPVVYINLKRDGDAFFRQIG